MRPELLQSAMSPARSATWVPGAITRIANESEPVRPALLVTDTRTLSRPSAEYGWLAVIGVGERDRQVGRHARVRRAVRTGIHRRRGRGRRVGRRRGRRVVARGRARVR